MLKTLVPDAPVLALIGEAGCGKTTVCNRLRINRPNSRRLTFAGPIRAMVTALISEATPRSWHTPPADYTRNADLKNAPIPFLNGLNARQLMQTLGTEWGRNTLHPDFWAGITAQKIERTLGSTFVGLEPGPKVLIDDARFPNEIEIIRAFGGAVVRIDRPDNPSRIGRAHESEMYFDKIVPDIVLVNDGDENALRRKVDAIWPPRPPKVRPVHKPRHPGKKRT
jgi:hypothetical protein